MIKQGCAVQWLCCVRCKAMASSIELQGGRRRVASGAAVLKFTPNGPNGAQLAKGLLRALQRPPTAPAPRLQSTHGQIHIAAAPWAAPSSGTSAQAPKRTRPHIWQRHPAAAPAPKLQSAHRHLCLYLK